MNKKGSNCSKNGKQYELQVYYVVKNIMFNRHPFNTQLEDELGGCTSKNDIDILSIVNSIFNINFLNKK